MNIRNSHHPVELSGIFEKYGQDYLVQHRLCPVQHRAFKAILACRTAQLGGHLETCDQCGYKKPSYNSCRNRHCPKCQYIKQLQWVDKLKSRLPVTRYFHLVFTIPQTLHKTFYINQQLCYDLLFKAAAQALRKAGQNPAFLGAETGAVAVLHTWGQALTYHPHVHMIVPAGGLSADQNEWIPAGKKFFLPVKALSKIFRAILCRLIEEHVSNKTIRLPDDIGCFPDLKIKLYAKNWNVYCKKAMGGPHAVLHYLGRYTHRVAISNSRLIDMENGKIKFLWKDYSDSSSRSMKALQLKTLTLDACEFIQRFLFHILPLGFYKIRYYGLLAAANSKTKKEQCFILIGKQPPLSYLEGLNAMEIFREITGKDPSVCPKCKKGRLKLIELFEKYPSPL